MILVTSATGTVGSELVSILKNQGTSLTAASRDPAKAQAALGVPAVEWNWDRPGAFARALKGVDALFLGTPPGVTQEKVYGLSAVAAAEEAGVKKIVKLSAVGVENMPDSPHRQVELAIEAGPFQWVFLRPNFFMQNLNESMAAGIRQTGAISVPCGSGRTAFIDARDIAAVAAHALTRDDLNGQGLTLTGAEALTYAEAATQLGKAIGRPLRHDDLPAADYTAQLISHGVPKSYAEMLTNLYDQVVRNGYAAGLSDAVRRVTGREPIRFARYALDHAKDF